MTKEECLREVAGVIFHQAKQMEKEDGFYFLTLACISLSSLPLSMLHEDAHQDFIEEYLNGMKKHLENYSAYIKAKRVNH